MLIYDTDEGTDAGGIGYRFQHSNEEACFISVASSQSLVQEEGSPKGYWTSRASISCCK